MKPQNTLRTLVITIMLFSLLGVTSSQAQTSETDEQATANSGYHQEGLLTLGQLFRELQERAFIGSWEGIFTPEEGGPPPFRIQFTFGERGTVVQSDGGPPNPQNATPGHGAWRLVGNREFLVTYKQLLFDKDGNLENLFKARIKFRLNRTGLEISGPVIVDFYDPQGNPLFGGPGTIKCTKIQAEPLD